jgi:hypothetical protein
MTMTIDYSTTQANVELDLLPLEDHVLDQVSGGQEVVQATVAALVQILFPPPPIKERGPVPCPYPNST